MLRNRDYMGRPREKSNNQKERTAMTEKIPPRRLGFDIDGVVADTAGAFIRLARDQYGLGEIDPAEITAFQVEDCLDIPPRKVEEIFGHLLTDPIGHGLEAMPNAIEVLNELAATAPLTFITARPQHRPIKEWLEAKLAPHAAKTMRLVAMGEHDGKGEHIRKMGLQYFIDDRAETCIRLAAEGLSPYVYNQPWNRGRHRLPAVDNWLAIRDLCAVAA